MIKASPASERAAKAKAQCSHRNTPESRMHKSAVGWRGKSNGASAKMEAAARKGYNEHVDSLREEAGSDMPTYQQALKTKWR